MKITVKLKYLRIAPRKVRLLADLIRGKNAEEAKTLLDFSLKRGSGPLKKLLASGVAAAKNQFQVEKENLRIAEIKVDEGPKLKRWRARARGRAFEIQKKTSHLSLTLASTVPVKKKPVPAAVKPPAKKEVKAKKEAKPKKPVARPKEPKREKGLVPTRPKKGVWKRVFRRKAF